MLWTIIILMSQQRKAKQSDYVFYLESHSHEVAKTRFEPRLFAFVAFALKHTLC